MSTFAQHSFEDYEKQNNNSNISGNKHPVCKSVFFTKLIHIKQQIIQKQIHDINEFCGGKEN